MLKYVAISGIVLYILTLSGFCFGQFGWKNDRELIELAFNHEFQGGWPNKPAISDLAAYLRDYPRCCSVDGSHSFMSSPLLNALFGRRFYAVSIKYPVTDAKLNDGEPFYESTLIMDCCGDYIPDMYGISSSLPVPKGSLQQSKP